MNSIKEQLSSINKMSKKSVALYHKYAASIDVSDSMFGILYALFEVNRPCSQYELFIEWSIPKQTINTSVNKLLKKGYIELLPVFDTRNKKHIVLTKLGEKFIKDTIKKVYDAEVSALSDFSSEEREIYIKLNEKYNESLNKKISNLFSR